MKPGWYVVSANGSFMQAINENGKWFYFWHGPKHESISRFDDKGIALLHANEFRKRYPEEPVGIVYLSGTATTQ